MKTQIKLLDHKIWHSMIIVQCSFGESMEEVVSETYIITNSSTQEIISQNKCQMRFLDKFLLKHNIDKNWL